MIRVGDSRGLTVVETMIFLTVSGALMVGAMIYVSGQQAKAEFRQAVGETQSLTDDVANNVSTGYYRSPSKNNVCINSANTPTLWTGQADKGESATCMVLGQVIQFDRAASGGNGSTFTTYSVLGFRARGAQLVQNLTVNTSTGASATLITDSSYIDVQQLPGGLTVGGAVYVDSGGVRRDVNGVAFVSSLGSFDSGQLQPGSAGMDVVPLTGSITTSRATGFINNANTILRTSGLPNKNPKDGVTVCLDSGGTNQHVLLRIGAASSVSSRLEYRNGMSAADGECRA